MITPIRRTPQGPVAELAVGDTLPPVVELIVRVPGFPDELLHSAEPDELPRIRSVVSLHLSKAKSEPAGRGYPVRWMYWSFTRPEGVEVISSTRLAEIIGCSTPMIHLAQKTARAFPEGHVPFSGIPDGLPVCRVKGACFARAADYEAMLRD